VRRIERPYHDQVAWEPVAEVTIPKAPHGFIEIGPPTPEIAAPATPPKPFAYFEEETASSDALPDPTPSQGPKARHAIVTSVWDANYAAFALMLGWSIKQHNPLSKLGIDLVLLTLQEVDGEPGITAENRTRLERAGWQIRIEDRLEVPGVNMSLIMKHRRSNLNKLKIFGWDEYDKIVFMDADMICKGPIEELFDMPGGMYSLHHKYYRNANRDG
jgi:hypothetical protein